MAHDSDGKRAKRVDNFGTVIYAGPHYERNVRAGADTSDTVTKMYWGANRSIPELVSVRRTVVGGSSSLYFLHHDHHGSTKAISGTSGGPMKYYPFGATHQEISSPPTDNLYTGQKRDLSTGLYFYGARYYNPLCGSFVQPDTIVPNPGDPQTLNRFAYALNNPLKYTDPTGHDTDEELYHKARGYEQSDGRWVYKGNYTAQVTTIEEARAAAGDANYVLIMLGGVGTQGYEPNLSGLASIAATKFADNNFAAFNLKYNAGKPGDSDFIPSGEGYSEARNRGYFLLTGVASDLGSAGKIVFAAGHSRRHREQGCSGHERPGAYRTVQQAILLRSTWWSDPKDISTDSRCCKQRIWLDSRYRY